MATIPGLYNTGDGVSAGEQDTHYSVVLPDTSEVFPYETYNNQFPVVTATWGLNDDVSQWLTPSASQGSSQPVGNYYWTLQFDLTGYDPSTASLAGRGKSDDNATVYLNGVTIKSGLNFNAWTTFSAVNSFVDGINELTFLVVNNNANPACTGLRIEFTSSSVDPYPEQPSNALMFCCNT